MYRVNLLPRKVLITSDEVIQLGPVDGTVDPRNLILAIQIAEERFIKKAICKAMYYEFRDQKNVEVTAINKAYLEGLINVGNSGEPVVLSEGQLVNAIEFVTDNWYKQLWYEHLWKLVAECVVYVATPTNYLRYSSAGEMQNNPKTITNEGQGAVSAESKDVKWKMDKLLMDRIDPLIESMHEWICDNKENFPLYDCKECACNDKNGVSYKRKTAWVNPYADEQKLNVVIK
jgi:hypothetical protein